MEGRSLVPSSVNATRDPGRCPNATHDLLPPSLPACPTVDVPVRLHSPSTSVATLPSQESDPRNVWEMSDSSTRGEGTWGYLVLSPRDYRLSSPQGTLFYAPRVDP